MSKFNLKNYKKTDGDEHIDGRLQESHQEAPDQISEAQLEDYRASEPDVLIEKMLEEKRSGGDDEITEKRLDDHKAKFANKYRNPDAYDGDINKLEEKRLKDDPVEKEEYKPASECPKQMRWWEGVKSPDGLKVAKDKKDIKMAQDDSDIEIDMDEDIADPDVNVDQVAEQIAEEAGQQEDKLNVDLTRMEIIKWKKIPNIEKPYLSGIYGVLAYDPSLFLGDEQKIRQTALQTVLEANSELIGKISEDDFYDIKEEGMEGTIKLRAIGEEFAPTTTTSNPSSFVGEGDYSEVGYQEKDIDGTPMAIGTVVVLKDVTEDNMPRIVKDVLEFIRSRHPNLQIDEESLDLIDLESKGEIGFAVGIMSPGDFPVKEASSKKKWIGIK